MKSIQLTDERMTERLGRSIGACMRAGDVVLYENDLPDNYSE